MTCFCLRSWRICGRFLALWHGLVSCL